MAPRKKPGKDAIMGAAEKLFSEYGYFGVSLRDITSLAQVELGLASYHFRTKDELFRQVVERRAQAMMDFELNALQKVIASSAGRPPTVEQILTAFVRSRFEMLYAMGPEWANYMRLSHHFLALKERGKFIGSFRESALRVRAAFTSALCATLPSLGAEQVGTIFDLLRLTVSGIAADTESLIVKSQGKAGREAAISKIVAVYAAGLRNSGTGEGAG